MGTPSECISITNVMTSIDGALTSFLQLAVTAITHFGHAVLHVFEWISVPGAAATDDLQHEGSRHQSSVRFLGGLRLQFDSYPSTAVAVMSAERQAEIGRAVHAHHDL